MRESDDGGGMQIGIRGGLDVHYDGTPRQVIEAGPMVSSVAVLGSDYAGLRPTFLVEPGDQVVAGQALIKDRRVPGRVIVAPVSGRVSGLTRGAHRGLDILSIGDIGDDRLAFARKDVRDRSELVQLLLESGNWAALIARPFGHPADLSTEPDALFITAIDTRPLAADPAVVIGAHADWFARGAAALTSLSSGRTYLCQAPGAAMPVADGVQAVSFSGRHPAGLPGTHIHHLHPVGHAGRVWQINYQDVIALGHLLATGQIWTERVIALGGPAMLHPGLYRTAPGATLQELVKGHLSTDAVHLFSGSPLDGEVQEHLSRRHLQIAAVPHRSARHQRLSTLHRLRHWAGAGIPAVIPNSAHERVAPPGILPIPLLRAIGVGDVETARALGALELVEEDLALLTYVDGSGTDFGALLRTTLDELAEAG